jgi:glycosyltransferase involved in cell wall biosynthesis
MATLFYVQPLIPRYRLEVAESLARLFELKIFAGSEQLAALGFSTENPSCDEFVGTDVVSIGIPRLKCQNKIFGRILRDRPNAVLIFGDLNYLSMWLILVAGRLIGVPIIMHGQGLFRYPDAGRIRRLTYRIAVKLSAKYICYSDASRVSLEEVGCAKAKLAVAHNSLCTPHTISPEEKTGDESGILFLGRLRNASNLEWLVEAVERMRSAGHKVCLHLIGDGEFGEKLRTMYQDRNYLIWHGAVYDEASIAEISRECRIGCYPGAAGLSVVHMFGLSLARFNLSYGTRAGICRRRKNRFPLQS